MAEVVPFAVSTDRTRVAAGECLSCGYNLCGLLPGDRCPECGRPVSRSLLGDGLFHQDSRWLVRVGLGCALLAPAAVADLVYGVAYVTGWPFPWPPAGGAGRMFTLPNLAYLSAAALAALASWLITTSPTPDAAPHFRGYVRYSCLAGAAVSWLALLMRTDTWTQWIIIQVTSVLVTLAATAGLWIYLFALALRGDRSRLGAQTLAVLTGQCLSIFFGGLLPWALGMRGIAAMWPAGIGWIYCFFSLWGLVLLVAYCDLFYRAGRAAHAAEALGFPIEPEHRGRA